MTRRACGAAVAALAALAVAAPATYAAGQPLNAYRVKADPETLEALAQAGYDVARAAGSTARWRSSRPPGRRGRSVATVSPRRWSAARGRPGLPRPRVPEGDDSGYDVWTRYDAVAGRRQGAVPRAVRPARRRADRQEDRRSGTTDIGRDIIALKVTKDAKTTRRQHAARRCSTTRCSTPASGSPARPAGARSTTSSTTTARHDAGARSRALVDTRELWFMLRRQPGRLRVHVHRRATACGARTCADNNGDGVDRRAGDGVDPNRNYATNWGLDNEGSSRRPASRDLPRHRPGLRARDQGDEEALGAWSTSTFHEERPHGGRAAAVAAAASSSTRRRPDNAIFEALAGDDVDSAIADKVWNADDESGRSPATGSTPTCRPSCTSPTATRSTTRTARTSILGFTPEGTAGATTRRQRASSSRTTRTRSSRSSGGTCCSRSTSRESADDPANPVSHLGNTAPGLLRRHVRASPTATRRPSQVTAKRVARRRHAALPHQRRPRCRTGADRRECHGRRALRQGPGRLLPPRARHRHGHQAGRRASRCGSSRPAASASPALHLHGARRRPATRC